MVPTKRAESPIPRSIAVPTRPARVIDMPEATRDLPNTTAANPYRYALIAWIHRIFLRSRSIEAVGVSSERIMAKTIEEPTQQPSEPVPRERVGRSMQRPRRTRVVVRRVGPFSILKFSLIFYFCVMLVFFFALLFLWGILSAAGLTLKVQHDIDLLFPGFAFDSTWIFERM